MTAPATARRDPLGPQAARAARAARRCEHAELVSLDELGVDGDPIEDGETFETNAAIKARFGARASGPADPRRRLRPRGRRARRRRPACRTRRYAGEHATDATNNAKLLDALRRPAARPARRALRRACSPLALPDDGGPARRRVALITARGTCRGRIATEPRGTGGFGYDPIFEPASEPPGGRTLGLWTPAEKNAISHRARAARAMAPRLAALGF